MSRIVKDTCPVCGQRMAPGRRMKVIVKWEGADVEKSVFDYDEFKWKKKAAVGEKGSTVTVCPECGMRAAGAVGIEKPGCVPW